MEAGKGQDRDLLGEKEENSLDSVCRFDPNAANHDRVGNSV